MGLILCPDALAAVKLPLMPVSLQLLRLLWAEVRTWRLLSAGLALQTGTWAPWSREGADAHRLARGRGSDS